jgi:hypothetical protein
MRHWPILAAAVVHWLLGAVWYTVFADPWIAGLKLDVATMQANMSPTPYVLTFVTLLIEAIALRQIIRWSKASSVGGGAAIGLLAGVGIAGMAMYSHYGFPQIPMIVYVIDLGYTAIGTVLMGMILAKWRS